MSTDSAPDRVPAWDEARPRLRYVLAPFHVERPPVGEIYDAVSNDAARRLVLGPPVGGELTGVTEAHLEAWGVARSDVETAAEENMVRLAAGATVTVTDVGGFHRGELHCPEPWVTAGLALSSAFRGLVEPVSEIEWPVLFVAPVREAVWVISVAARPFLGRLGVDVVQAVLAADQPVSAEVFLADDAGIRAIGTFAPRSIAPPATEDA